MLLLSPQSLLVLYNLLCVLMKKTTAQKEFVKWYKLYWSLLIGLWVIFSINWIPVCQSRKWHSTPRLWHQSVLHYIRTWDTPTMFDELWSEIADAPGEIFDLPELRDLEEGKFDVNEYLNSNIDYWWNPLKSSASFIILFLTKRTSNDSNYWCRCNYTLRHSFLSRRPRWWRSLWSWSFCFIPL